SRTTPWRRRRSTNRWRWWPTGREGEQCSSPSIIQAAASGSKALSAAPVLRHADGRIDGPGLDAPLHHATQCKDDAWRGNGALHVTGGPHVDDLGGGQPPVDGTLHRQVAREDVGLQAGVV